MREVEADPVNADKPQELLRLLASGGPSHGRKYGLGSKHSKIVIPTEMTRGKATNYYIHELNWGIIVQI
jgi:hypothetical protein